MRYHILKIVITLVFSIFVTSCVTTDVKSTNDMKLKGTIMVFPEDVANYNPQTGVGCVVTRDPSNNNQAHIVCRSKHSGESAWNAVTARSKEMCSSQKWSMLFKQPPSLPIENGVYGAQMDILCIP